MRDIPRTDDAAAWPDLPSWALDDVPFGIALLRAPDLTFVYSNRVYESWYQSDRWPIVGKRLEDALAVAPQVVTIFRDAARRGEPVHFHNSEFVGLRNRPVVLPGDVTKWDWSIWPVKETGGKVTHLLVSGFDVTGPALDRLMLDEAHEEGIRALLEVSRLAGAGGSLDEFFGELSRTVARLVGARKVLFSRAENGSMSILPHTYGFDDSMLAGISVPCAPEGDGLADRIVYQDEVFRASIGSSPEFEAYRGALEMMEVGDAVAVGWRVGDLRLGLVAAFNSYRKDGFNDEDLHLLKVASMAAGLVWQHRETQSRLAEAQQQETKRLKADAEHMAALERTKADFLRLASHEMRGPITVASVYASMLSEGSMGEAPDAVRETSAIIASKIRELDRMVDQILEASRLDDPTLKLDAATFDVRDTVAAALEHAHQTRHPRHYLKAEIASEPVYVRSDRERVLMIVANLVDNAIKYSPAGGVVTCSARRVGDHAEVRVADQGIGIAAADLPRLFTRFSRVGGVRTEPIPGTGLGLYLCRQTARQLGGDVSVESELGAGSTFTLVLPIAP